jgi:hypothetical protein
MAKKVINWAAREKRRSVTKGVGKSFLKTVTEPITNSDSILKKKSGVEHSAGLVNLILQVPTGQQVNTEQLKRQIPKQTNRQINLEVATAGSHARRCRIIDRGLGMSLPEIEKKFGDYAEAKARGEKTRSLFGRGALDVLLYHDDSYIYSVKDGELVRCRFFWENEPMLDPEPLGKATPAALKRLGLPADILGGGTVVEFSIHADTPIPSEDQIISRLSSFYMLRLIAADPNAEVVVRRKRQDGIHTDVLSYDFPIGTVIGRFSDSLPVAGHGKIPIEILVARADVDLPADPDNIERRGNGLLFVDENDAVLDLTLTGDFDKNPYLRKMYGLVRLTGIRSVLEAKLEAKNPEAILTETRDGFDRRHDLTIALFNLVGKHVRPLFEREERNQRKSDAQRSEVVTQRLKDALRAFNQFSADETDNSGDEPGGPGPTPPPPSASQPIYFEVDSTRLHAGVTRKIMAFVNLERVPTGEIVLFESTNPNIRVLPESSIVEAKGRGERMQIPIHVTCDVKGETGVIEAVTLDKDGKEHRARCEVRHVGEAPIPRVPQDIEFTAPIFSGKPNRENKAMLLVNLDAFPGKPEVTFWLEEVVGNVNLSDGKRLQIKVTQEDIVAGSRVARLAVTYKGNAWGQRAILLAKAKKKDGSEARARCRLKFDVELESNKFSDIRYHDLERNVLGDVAENILYVNSGYALHKQIFGDTEEDFYQSLETDRTAQIRSAAILIEAVIYNAASTKWLAGGKKGLDVRPNDPVGSVRDYVEESRMKLEGKIYRALVVAPRDALETAS